MEDLANFDLELYIENLDVSACSTPLWYGTKDQELTKILDDLMPVSTLPMNDSTNSQTYQMPVEAKTSRFAAPISDAELSSFTKPFTPLSTQKNTRWCIKVFNDWAAGRNTHEGVEKIPVGFLELPDCACNTAVLNKWLTKFVLEGTRRRPCPPDTIYVLLCGLYRYIQSLFGESVPNFLSRKNLAFKELNAATDRHYRDLRASGVGTEKKSVLRGNLMKKCTKDHLLRRLEYLKVDSEKTKYP